jgi:hypothetical protein
MSGALFCQQRIRPKDGRETEDHTNSWVNRYLMVVLVTIKIQGLILSASTYQVISTKQRGLMGGIMGNNKEHNTACNRWKGKEPQDWTFDSPYHCQICTSQRSDQLDRSKGHVEEDRVKTVVSESFDDQRAEGGDTTARNSTPIMRKCPILNNETKERLLRAYEIVNSMANHNQVFRSKRVSLT